MTRKECLAKFILAREYNPDCECVNYNSDWKHEVEICPSGLSICGLHISANGEDDLLNHICEIDASVWNGMESRCNNCKFRDGESIKKMESPLDTNDDVDVSCFLVYRTVDPADGTYTN